MATVTKSAPTDGPTTTLTVPAKPALTTAANLATLAGSAMVVAGPPGWIAGAAVAAGGAAVGVTRSVRRRRARQAALGGFPVIGGVGGPASRRAASGSSGRAAGGGRSSTGRPAAGGRAATGGRTAGRGSGSGRAGGLLGRLGRAGSGAGTSAGRTGSGRGPSLGGRAGGRTATRRGPLGRLAAAGRRTAAAIGAGRNAATPRAAATAARRHANRPTPTGRKRTKALGAAGVAAGLVGARNGFRKARRWVRRNVLGEPEPTKAERKTPAKQPPQRQTGNQVRRPDDKRNPDRSGAPKPGTTSTTEREPTMTANGQAPQPSSHFWQSARQLHAAAAKFQPRGMMEVRAECAELPYALSEIASALRARAQACTQHPLHAQMAQLFMQISACVDSAAQASTQLYPAFDALHPTEVRRILQPRPNEPAWDVNNNRP